MATKKEEALARKAERLEQEKKRIYEMKEYERRHQDCAYICGMDEAGRGPFAGPVVAGAVILDLDDPEKEILYLNDSKKLSEKKREALYAEILLKARAVGVGVVGVKVIDKINILQATYVAMHKAIQNLKDVSSLVSEGIDTHELVKAFTKYDMDEAAGKKLTPDIILADAVKIPELDIPQEGIIKGDAKSVSIAAASIVAKVTRDHIMFEYDTRYPEYSFAKNKGYGTAGHIEAIKTYGMTEIHRRSFIHFETFDRHD